LIEARPDIRAVVTDVEMPGRLNGFALGRHVTEKRPFIGLVVVSGRQRPGPDDLPDGGLASWPNLTRLMICSGSCIRPSGFMS
jgi:hypothetical protein